MCLLVCVCVRIGNEEIVWLADCSSVRCRNVASDNQVIHTLMSLIKCEWMRLWNHLKSSNMCKKICNSKQDLTYTYLVGNTHRDIHTHICVWHTHTDMLLHTEVDKCTHYISCMSIMSWVYVAAIYVSVCMCVSLLGWLAGWMAGWRVLQRALLSSSTSAYTNHSRRTNIFI